MLNKNSMLVYQVAFLSLLLLLLCCQLALSEAGDTKQTASPSSPSQNDAPKPECVTTKTKPEPKHNRYTYDGCVAAEFGAYLKIGDNEYFELENGIVDESSSRCFNDSSDDQEPVLAIKFDCGLLKLNVITKELKNVGEVSHIALNGNFELSERFRFHTPIAYFNNSNCMFLEESGEQQKVSVDKKVSTILIDQMFEFHREKPVEHELNKCNAGINLFIWIPLGLIAIIIVVVVLIYVKTTTTICRKIFI